METEKAIIRDIWQYLRDHNRLPAGDTHGSAEQWELAAKELCDLVSGKWHDHPLATALGIAVYSYLEQKCLAKPLVTGVTL